MCILRHGDVLLAIACFNAVQVITLSEITLSDDEHASVGLALFSVHFKA